ncbi:hypothetical protein GCM10009837_24240 [Streptomyces durmitorensis]
MTRKPLWPVMWSVQVRESRGVGGTATGATGTAGTVGTAGMERTPTEWGISRSTSRTGACVADADPSGRPLSEAVHIMEI